MEYLHESARALVLVGQEQRRTCGPGEWAAAGEGTFGDAEAPRLQSRGQSEGPLIPPNELINHVWHHSGRADETRDVEKGVSEGHVGRRTTPAAGAYTQSGDACPAKRWVFSGHHAGGPRQHPNYQGRRTQGSSSQSPPRLLPLRSRASHGSHSTHGSGCPAGGRIRTRVARARSKAPSGPPRLSASS